jgi:hypothetical protein
MIIRTFQEHGVVQQAIDRDGVYMATSDLSGWLKSDRDNHSSMFTDAYRWMSATMEASGLEKPAQDAVPIWSWARMLYDEYTDHAVWKPRNWIGALRFKYGRCRELTDWSPRHLNDLIPFEGWINGLDLITLDVPVDRMLCTDLDGWNYVLNQWPIFNDDAREMAYEQGDLTDDEVMKTWDECIVDPSDISRHDEVQACMWTIRSEDIVSIKIMK